MLSFHRKFRDSSWIWCCFVWFWQEDVSPSWKESNPLVNLPSQMMHSHRPLHTHDKYAPWTLLSIEHGTLSSHAMWPFLSLCHSCLMLAQVLCEMWNWVLIRAFQQGTNVNKLVYIEEGWQGNDLRFDSSEMWQLSCISDSQIDHLACLLLLFSICTLRIPWRHLDDTAICRKILVWTARQPKEEEKQQRLISDTMKLKFFSKERQLQTILQWSYVFLLP